MEISYTFLAATLLFAMAFVNGGNDVSKPIATLAGTKVASLKTAVSWGTLWTVAGALAGLYWGEAIVKNITQSIFIAPPDFSFPLALATVGAPILWVTLATWRKWPVSTTHALIGGVVGSGILSFGTSGIAWDIIGSKIALPLLISPLLAILLTVLLTPLLKRIANSISRTHICITPVPRLVYSSASKEMSPAVDDCITCDQDSIQSKLTAGISLNIDHLHWLTSGLLSFSRGLNDTPKLIAIVLPFMVLNHGEVPVWLYFLAAIAMGAGSLLAGRKITELLGFNVTPLSHAEGFSANFVSTVLVMGATPLGLPVSTTHVSTSSIMGIGLNNGHGLNKRVVYTILFAWLVTVPATAFLGALIYSVSTT